MSRSLDLEIGRARAFPTQVNARAFKAAKGVELLRRSRVAWDRLWMVGHSDPGRKRTFNPSNQPGAIAGEHAAKAKNVLIDSEVD